MSDFASLLVGVPPAPWFELNPVPRRSQRLAAAAAAAGPRRSQRLAAKAEQRAVVEAASVAAAAAHQRNVLEAVIAAKKILAATQAVLQTPLQEAVASAAAQLAADNASGAADGSGPYREKVRECLELAQYAYQSALGQLYMAEDREMPTDRYERKLAMAEAELISWEQEARLMGIID